MEKENIQLMVKIRRLKNQLKEENGAREMLLDRLEAELEQAREENYWMELHLEKVEEENNQQRKEIEEEEEVTIMERDGAFEEEVMKLTSENRELEMEVKRLRSILEEGEEEEAKDKREEEEAKEEERCGMLETEYPSDEITEQGEASVETLEEVPAEWREGGGLVEEEEEEEEVEVVLKREVTAETRRLLEEKASFNKDPCSFEKDVGENDNTAERKLENTDGIKDHDSLSTVGRMARLYPHLNVTTVKPNTGSNAKTNKSYCEELLRNYAMKDNKGKEVEVEEKDE